MWISQSAMRISQSVQCKYFSETRGVHKAFTNRVTHIHIYIYIYIMEYTNPCLPTTLIDHTNISAHSACVLHKTYTPQWTVCTKQNACSSTPIHRRRWTCYSTEGNTEYPEGRLYSLRRTTPSSPLLCSHVSSNVHSLLCGVCEYAECIPLNGVP